MLRRIKRKECLSLYQSTPLSDGAIDFYFFPKTISAYILSYAPEKKRIRSIALANSLSTLLQDMGYQQVIFIGDNTRPWLYQKNTYRPVRVAMEYLTANDISPSFNGGIIVNLPEEKAFIRHLYWLVGCNAALPYFHFLDPQQGIVGSLCQYGHIHLSSLTKEADRKINEALKGSDLIKIERC